MKYVIRKVPERNTKYLERLLPDALIYNDIEHHGCIYSFLKAIETVDDDCIYIQDDMLLATYIPRSIAQAFLQFMLSDEYKTFKRYYSVCVKNESDDTLFAMFLKRISKGVFLTVPMLAGHEENESSVCSKRPIRISPEFDYDNCEKKLPEEV